MLYASNGAEYTQRHKKVKKRSRIKRNEKAAVSLSSLEKLVPLHVRLL